jgi:poly(3-hydroxybutyrate) depolymerase
VRTFLARHREALKLAAVVIGSAVVVYAVNHKQARRILLPIWTGGDAGMAAASPPESSPGCADPAAKRIGLVSATVTVAGQGRRYDMLVPRSAADGRALAVVFFFHGRRRRGTTAPNRGPSELAAATASGAIVVAPQGLHYPEYDAAGWDLACGGVDMQFFDAMLGAVGKSHCIDPRAVFASGFSWGADMVDALACCRGDELRAIAPASGGELDANRTCPARRMPAFRLTHGDHEPYPRELFSASVDFFRAVHRCSPEADPTAPFPCVSFRGCARPVVACHYEGMGHAMPPDFGPATWAFFRSTMAEPR